MQQCVIIIVCCYYHYKHPSIHHFKIELEWFVETKKNYMLCKTVNLYAK